MRLPIVFMYSGQGAQYYGMGRELYAQEPEFRKAMDACNEIAADYFGFDLLNEIYQPSVHPHTPFEQTKLTHPANFIMGYSLTELLYSRGIEPEMVVGYSLGEYIASVIAGALSLEQAIKMIGEQGQLFEDHAPEAGMLAILGDPAMFDTRKDLFSESWLACLNFSSHFVITATKPKLASIEHQLNSEGVTTQLLPITRGFHSPLIEAVALDFPSYARGFQPLRLPVVSSRLASELTAMNAEELWEACREPVRFQQTMAFLEASGSKCYIDVGPAGTLQNFAKYNLPSHSASKCLSVMNPFGKNSQSFARLLQQLAI